MNIKNIHCRKAFDPKTPKRKITTVSVYDQYPKRQHKEHFNDSRGCKENDASPFPKKSTINISENENIDCEIENTVRRRFFLSPVNFVSIEQMAIPYKLNDAFKSDKECFYKGKSNAGNKTPKRKINTVSVYDQYPKRQHKQNSKDSWQCKKSDAIVSPKTTVRGQSHDVFGNQMVSGSRDRTPLKNLSSLTPLENLATYQTGTRTTNRFSCAFDQKPMNSVHKEMYYYFLGGGRYKRIPNRDTRKIIAMATIIDEATSLNFEYGFLAETFEVALSETLFACACLEALNLEMNIPIFVNYKCDMMINLDSRLDSNFTGESSRKTSCFSKKHVCPNCNKSFGDSYDLKRHMRSHSGIKPFQCNVCSKSFAQLCSLEKHERKKHDIVPPYAYKERRSKTYICEHCGATTQSPEQHYLHLLGNHQDSPVLRKVWDRRVFKFNSGFPLSLKESTSNSNSDFEF